jgi:hypothetical protein
VTTHLGDQTTTRRTPDTAAPIHFPTDFLASFAPRATRVSFVVTATAEGQLVADAVSPLVDVVPEEVKSVEIRLIGGDAPLPGRSDLGDPAAPAPSDLGTAPAATAPSSYAGVVLQDQPAAYYRLDETGGKIAFDSSGNGLHGSVGAAITLGAPSLLPNGAGHAAQFPSGRWSPASLIMVPPNAKLEMGDALTIELWMRTPSINQFDTALVSYGNSLTLPGAPYALNLNRGPFFYRVLTDRLAGDPTVRSNQSAALNTTYHVVATYDGQALRLYVNGALDTVTPRSGGLTNYDSQNGLAIGGFFNLPAPIYGGVLDEVALYPVALSAARVKAHYDAGQPAQ